MKHKIIIITLLILICGLCKMSAAPVVEELCIPSGNTEIFGLLSRPNNDAKKQPIAIIAHGFNGSYDFGRNYFDALNDMGYQVYTFDFPCGSVNSRRDNNTLNMSIIDEQQYLEAIVNYFKNKDDVDTDNIVLIGESQGGLVSALTAANKSNGISRLVLVYPALCIPDNWNTTYKEIADIPEVTTLWNVKLGRRFFTELRYLDVYSIIGKYDGPVQIIHGSVDKVVPVSYSEKAAKLYNNADLMVISGAGHGFNPEDFKLSLNKIRDFLKS